MNKYQTARKVVEQIKNNEWTFDYIKSQRDCFVMNKGVVSVWITNTPFDCKMWLPKEGFDMFGVFRVWVYFVARAKAKEVRRAEEKLTKENVNSIIARDILGVKVEGKS